MPFQGALLLKDKFNEPRNIILMCDEFEALYDEFKLTVIPHFGKHGAEMKVQNSKKYQNVFMFSSILPLLGLSSGLHTGDKNR